MIHPHFFCFRLFFKAIDETKKTCYFFKTLASNNGVGGKLAPKRSFELQSIPGGEDNGTGRRNDDQLRTKSVIASLDPTL